MLPGSSGGGIRVRSGYDSIPIELWWQHARHIALVGDPVGGSMKLTVRPFTPARWSDLEAIFNAKGCSIARGCWCMFYRRSGRPDGPGYDACEHQSYCAEGARRNGRTARPDRIPGQNAGGLGIAGSARRLCEVKRSQVMKAVDDRPCGRSSVSWCLRSFAARASRTNCFAVRLRTRRTRGATARSVSGRQARPRPRRFDVVRFEVDVRRGRIRRGRASQTTSARRKTSVR